MSLELLKGVEKGFTLGTHRACTPEETLERVSPHIVRMGITRVANITGLDRLDVPVTMVCRPNSRSLAVFQGKGLSLAAAKISGIMEAAETWHAERVRLALKLGSWRELEASHSLVSVEHLPRSAEGALTRDRRILWVEGSELNEDVRLWLPFELVHTDYTIPRPTGSGCFPGTRSPKKSIARTRMITNSKAPPPAMIAFVICCCSRSFCTSPRCSTAGAFRHW